MKLLGTSLRRIIRKGMKRMEKLQKQKRTNQSKFPEKKSRTDEVN